MKKTLRAAAMFLFVSPLLVQCVPSQDVNSLDLRVRNLDNQVFMLGKAVNKMGGGTGADNPLDRIEAKQAEMADNIDRLNSEVMHIKEKMDESGHKTKLSQSDNANLQKKMDELSAQVAALSNQVNQNAPVAKSEPPPAPSPAEKAAPPPPAKKGAEAGAGKSSPPAKAEAKAAPDSEAAAPGDPGKAIYDKGLELFRTSKFNDAYRTFNDYITKYPKGKMAPNARFWLGDCYYNQQEYELAILEYQKVIADYPKDGKAPSALLKQGLAFEKLKDKDTAKIVYNKLVKDYPKSDQVETAKKRLEALK